MPLSGSDECWVSFVLPDSLLSPLDSVSVIDLTIEWIGNMKNPRVPLGHSDPGPSRNLQLNSEALSSIAIAVSQH